MSILVNFRNGRYVVAVGGTIVTTSPVVLFLAWFPNVTFDRDWSGFRAEQGRPSMRHR